MGSPRLLLQLAALACASSAALVAQSPDGDPGRASIESMLAGYSERLSRCVCEYRVRRHTPLTPGALYARWRVGPAILADSTDRLTMHDGRFRFVTEPVAVDALTRNRGERREVVFDGQSVHFTDQHQLALFYRRNDSTIAELSLFRSPYFEALDVQLPDRGELLTTLPHSRLLAALASGATVECKDDDTAVLRYQAAGLDVVVRLDLGRPGNLLERVESRLGKPVSRSTYRHPIDIGRYWIPRETRTDYFTWPSAQNDHSEDALLTIETDVTHIDFVVQPSDLTPDALLGGTQIVDHRGSGATGPVTYDTPYSGEQLTRAFEMTTPRQGWPKTDPRALVHWVVICAAALVLQTLWPKKRRQSCP